LKALKMISLSSDRRDDAHMICARIFIARGDYSKTEHHLAAAVALIRSKPVVRFKALFECYKEFYEVRVKQKDFKGAIDCCRNMIELVYLPQSGAGDTDIDALFDRIDTAIRSSRGAGVYLNPELETIHRKNPVCFLNEVYNNVEMLRHAKIIKTKPIDMIVSLTGRCNLNCIMCGETEFKKWDIPVSVVEEIKSYYPYLKSIQWRGGEAFLSSHFEDLVETALQYPHLEQSLNTNGLLINEAWADRFVRGAFRIIFSIDGIRTATYEAIRQGGKYTNLISGLKLIKKARRNASQRMNVSMTFVVMKLNYKDLPNLVDFAVEHGIDELRVSKLVPFGIHSLSVENVFSDPAVCREVSRNIKRLEDEARKNRIVFKNWFDDGCADERAMPVLTDPLVTAREAERRKSAARTMMCSAPWKYLFINTGGDVFPHCFCSTVLGNLSKESLADIWNGLAIQKLRQADPECLRSNLSRCSELTF